MILYKIRFVIKLKKPISTAFFLLFLSTIRIIFIFLSGISRDVVMAGRSRRSSTELEPDLSAPSAPKKTKRSETSSGKLSAEEQLTEVEGTELTPSTSEISLQTEVASLEKGHEQTSDVAEQTEQTSEQSILIGEAAAKSTEQLTQTSRELSERQEGDTATISTEAIPSTSKEEPLGPLKAIIMKYSEESELSGPSQKGLEGETNVQSFLLREHGSSYEDLFLIGNGAYGTVYRAKDKTSGQIVALKKVRVPLTEDGLPMSTLREIATLKSLERYEHPHIVSFIFLRYLIKFILMNILLFLFC